MVFAQVQHRTAIPSTVSREIRRNSGVRGRYNWETAQVNAVQVCYL